MIEIDIRPGIDLIKETRNWMADPHPVRIVPEATWKKIMGVVKAADRDSPVGIAFAMDHLREYLRKRK